MRLLHIRKIHRFLHFVGAFLKMNFIITMFCVGQLVLRVGRLLLRSFIRCRCHCHSVFWFLFHLLLIRLSRFSSSFYFFVSSTSLRTIRVGLCDCRCSHTHSSYKQIEKPKILRTISKLNFQLTLYDKSFSFRKFLHILRHQSLKIQPNNSSETIEYFSFSFRFFCSVFVDEFIFRFDKLHALLAAGQEGNWSKSNIVL